MNDLQIANLSMAKLETGCSYCFFYPNDMGINAVNKIIEWGHVSGCNILMLPDTIDVRDMKQALIAMGDK